MAADQEAERRLTGWWDHVTWDEGDGSLISGELVIEFRGPSEPLEGRTLIEWRRATAVVIEAVQGSEIAWEGDGVMMSGRIAPEYKGMWAADELTCTIDENGRLVGTGIDVGERRTWLVVLEPAHRVK